MKNDPGIPSPYPSPEIGARIVSPFVNEYYATEAYVWLQLVQTCSDLEIEEIASHCEGDLPPWWEEVMELGGLDAQMDIPWRGEGPRILDWAIREGLSPYQPFLLQVRRPEYFQDFEGEWDCTTSVRIVRKLPPQIGCRKFEQIVAEIFEDLRLHAAHLEDLRRAQWADWERLFLGWDFYCVGVYREYSVPTGISCLLRTSRVSLDKEDCGCFNLLVGRSDCGWRDEAKARLKAQAVKNGIPDYVFDKIPERG